MKTHCNVGQGFGGNWVATYTAGGMKGHSGVDSQCGYGTPIHSYFDKEYVYKVLTVENPANDGSGFTGVFTIVDNGIECFEFLYGHCNPSVQVGQILTKGMVIGTEANNGEVYGNNGDGTFTRITLAMREAGDMRGAHRHDQKRILRKMKNIIDGQFLTTIGGGLYQDNEGYYYNIPYWNNGYRGCVNFLLPLFNRNLYLGLSGYDVKCLQNFLRARGFLNIVETTDFFGNMTRQAVMAFQKANGISPMFGFVGPTTRALINNLLI